MKSMTIIIIILSEVKLWICKWCKQNNYKLFSHLLRTVYNYKWQLKYIVKKTNILFNSKLCNFTKWVFSNAGIQNLS